jgi:multicomponent Na+:H+ antiporter subunit E
VNRVRARLAAPVTAVWLVVLWVLLWADLSVANVLSGIAIAIIVLVIANARSVTSLVGEGEIHIAPFRLVWFVGWVLVKLVQANLVLTWEIVTPRNRIRTGVIAVPMRTDSAWVYMVVANVITLTPGTVTIEVAGTPPVLYVHVLHLHDVDRVRRDLQQIEAHAVRAFGSRRARAQLAERDATPAEEARS